MIKISESSTLKIHKNNFPQYALADEILSNPNSENSSLWIAHLWSPIFLINLFLGSNRTIGVIFPIEEIQPDRGMHHDLIVNAIRYHCSVVDGDEIGEAADNASICIATQTAPEYFYLCDPESENKWSGVFHSTTPRFIKCEHKMFLLDKCDNIQPLIKSSDKAMDCFRKSQKD